MLVHICCSVDSHYFLRKLQELYPKTKLVGFFYDPNIHPYSEYCLRLLDVKRSCKMLNIELIEGEYDIENWLKSVKGLENEPEKGARCSVCFDRRFEVSAKKAKELGIDSFTSTLLTSPKKSLQQLQTAGDRLATNEGITFVAPDFRKASGTQEQNILAKKDALYRQDYCGCMFGLNIQREQQNRIADELISPISKQVQPESIEDRINLYEKRCKYEELKQPYRIIKQRFLNWRLIYGTLRVQNKVVPSHIIPYSTLKKPFTRGRVEYHIDKVHYLGRDEVRFITLDYYNTLLGQNYESITQLIYSPPIFQDEIILRQKIDLTQFSSSLIMVVEEIPISKVEIICESKIYDDVKEVLIST